MILIRFIKVCLLLLRSGEGRGAALESGATAEDGSK